ncbi:MAG: M23 family metallopeptidase [Ilumatobacteraceae bacterium]
MDGRSTEPAHVTRRAVVLGGVAAVAGGLALMARRPEHAGAAAGSVAPDVTLRMESIGSSAAVTRTARRLGRPGRIRFPLDPTPRCYVLDNFSEARSGGRSHAGVDILTTLGQAVYAVADGVLVTQTVGGALSGNAWGFTADDGQFFYYAHLSAFASGLQQGSRVSVGDVIAYVGDTGNPGAGNYHLHFEVHPSGMNTPAVDPLPLLDVPSSCTVS